jgi:hypothetical protein
VIEYNLIHITLAAVVLYLSRPLSYLVSIMSSVEGMRTEVSESELSVTLNTTAFDAANPQPLATYLASISRAILGSWW